MGTQGRVPKLWQRVFVTIAAIVAGGFMLVFGVWSLLFSRSFAALIDFPPYNLHLLHDVGAFQIGIGVSVLVSLIWSDSIGVALVAFIVAGTIHSINHALDRHLGGHSFDQWGLGGLVLLAVAALIIPLTRRVPTSAAHLSRPSADMRTAWTSRRSRLEIIEPTATSIARGNEAVERLIARLAPLFPPGDAMSPEQFAVAFYQALGFDAPRSSWMSDTQPAATTAHEPAPWDTEVPLDRLATAPFRQVPLLDRQQVMFATFWDKGLI